MCDDYSLSPQTAWTAVHYFDRYLAARGQAPIERDEAELISLTCVFLAAKFFERQSPVSRRGRRRTRPPPAPPPTRAHAPVARRLLAIPSLASPPLRLAVSSRGRKVGGTQSRPMSPPLRPAVAAPVARVRCAYPARLPHHPHGRPLAPSSPMRRLSPLLTC